MQYYLQYYMNYYNYYCYCYYYCHQGLGMRNESVTFPINSKFEVEFFLKVKTIFRIDMSLSTLPTACSMFVTVQLSMCTCKTTHAVLLQSRWENSIHFSLMLCLTIQVCFSAWELRWPVICCCCCYCCCSCSCCCWSCCCCCCCCFCSRCYYYRGSYC